jgi:alkylation response protein AidB-like acyl-CoA dehydrogenase
MRAEPVDGGFLVSGSKTWATGADVADYIFALVRTGPAGSGYRGLSVLLLPRAELSMTITPIPKLAGQATHSCEIRIDNGFVPAQYLVGELNRGADVVLPLLEMERVICAAQCVGMAQGAYDTAVAYAAQRMQFGRPVIEHQAIGHLLVEMAADVECARLVAYHAAWEMESPTAAQAATSAMAKLVCSQIASSVASRGMSVMGAYSYSPDYPMERYYREVKLFEIAGGTSHILKNIIAKRLRPGPVASW